MVKINLYDFYFLIKSKFKINGISNYDMEANWLISSHFGCSSTDIYMAKDIYVSKFQYKLFLDKISLRLKGYPLQYILGECFFYGRKFFVGEGVLIPREDTEVLCKTVIDILNSYNNYSSILDLCSGTGCIGITLEKETNITDITCVEKYDEAYNFLIKNMIYHSSNINTVKLDVLEFDSIIDNKFYDIIVSNPPYLNKSDICNLQRELEFEPINALFSDDSGLMFYKFIAEFWKRSISIGGVLIFEIGKDQHDAVTHILKINNFENISCIKDDNSVIRVIYGFKNKE